MLRACCLFTLVVSWLSVAPVMASDLIVPVSQNRSVSLSASAVDLTGSDQDSDSLAALDFELFDYSTSVTASVTDAVASSSGSHSSEILSASLQAAGGISASAQAYNYEASGTADGASRCEVTFDVTAPSSFTLSGTVTAFADFNNGDATVTLDGPAGTIVSVSAATNQTTPFLQTGSLAPDTYTLVASATGWALGDFFIAFGCSAGYDLVLTLVPATSVPAYNTTIQSAPVAAPNPFREFTTISHTAPSGVPVDMTIFDVRGRLVRRLTAVGGERGPSWDGRNGLGELVLPGVYFVRLEDSGAVHHLKVTRMH